ncbi:hypothetical protein NT01EI_3686 [Edwardsiella ictaluri 93-146]|uniref:Uncharacterized protein n=1 Tax=Edwardsiella ictaluri (strain 93-146) TaxID=634503 RepID=C5B974_EDWI9|nr:hypothetical protein NT01EI_3686 [Edwardsiella ictaluri 93-146]
MRQVVGTQQLQCVNGQRIPRLALCRADAPQVFRTDPERQRSAGQRWQRPLQPDWYGAEQHQHCVSGTQIRKKKWQRLMWR